MPGGVVKPVERWVCTVIGMVMVLMAAGVTLPGGAAWAKSPVQRSSQRVSLDVKEADVHNVLRLLSKMGNVNIVVGDQVSGKVTLRLEQVVWTDALDALLAARSLGVERQGEILFVDTLANIRSRTEARAAVEGASDALAPLVTEHFVLNNARAEELKPLLAGFLSSRGNIQADSRTNSLLVTDIAERVEKIRALVR